MGWKIYFVLLTLFSTLQALGFVLARLATPGAPFDLVSGIFNIGILILGPLVTYLYAFKKNLLSSEIWKGTFVFIAVGVTYALYFLFFVMPHRLPGHHVPLLLFVLHLGYVPLLVANYRLAWRGK